MAFPQSPDGSNPAGELTHKESPIDVDSLTVTMEEVRLLPAFLQRLVGTVMAQPEAFVYDAIRTPRGKGKKDGSLHGTKPVDLVVGLIDALQERNPSLDTNRIDDVVLGVVSPIG